MTRFVRGLRSGFAAKLIREWRGLALATLMVATGHAATLYTTPQVLDTGLKGTTGQITNLTFAQFDTSLGTLTDVFLRLDGYAEAGYSFADLSGDINNFQFSANVTVRIANPSDPGNPLAVTIPALGDIARSVPALGSYSTPGFPTLRSLTGSNSTGLLDFTSASILALFQGPGTINLPTSGSIVWSFQSDGDAQTGITSRYLGQATLYYGYTEAVPEPATAVLLFSGMGTMGIVTLRRRSRSS